MDTQQPNNYSNSPRPRGHVLAGLFLLLIGAAFLLKEMAFPFFPWWLFTWPVLLITIGIYSGIKHEFRNPGWIIMIIIGGIFLLDEVDLGFDLHRFIVPFIIIAVGFFMIVRPRGHWRNRPWRTRDWRQWRGTNWGNQTYTQPPGTGESASQGFRESNSPDFFESTSIFGGVKKVIVSKNFRGGDITCFMGGCEVDLTQADVQEPAIVEVSEFFGGTKLIIPAHWQVRTEMTAIFGSVEDKRQQTLNTDSSKLLILRGSSVFGGIEIQELLKLPGQFLLPGNCPLGQYYIPSKKITWL